MVGRLSGWKPGLGGEFLLITWDADNRLLLPQASYLVHHEIKVN